MKNTVNHFWAIIIIIIGIAYIFAEPQNKKCPVKGDGSQSKLQHLDSLKNRSTVSDKINPAITLDSILKMGDDRNRWYTTDCADITGYVYDVKYGGAETCECHSSEKKDLDIHIEIVKDLKDADAVKRVIVEINRYFRASDKSLDYDVVKLLKGKKVEVKGYLFMDYEHWQNALHTNPNGTNIWRNTIVELHPVFYIKEIK